MFLRCICMQILAQSSKNPYFSYSLDAIGEAKWFCWSLNAYPLKRPSYPLWTELQAIFFEWWCHFPRETTDLWMQRINVPSQGCLSAQRHFSVLSSHVHTPSFYVHRFQDWKCHRFLPCLSTTKLVTKDEVTTRTAESVLLTKRYSAPSAIFKTH